MILLCADDVKVLRIQNGGGGCEIEFVPAGELRENDLIWREPGTIVRTGEEINSGWGTVGEILKKEGDIFISDIGRMALWDGELEKWANENALICLENLEPGDKVLSKFPDCVKEAISKRGR